MPLIEENELMSTLLSAPRRVPTGFGGRPGRERTVVARTAMTDFGGGEAATAAAWVAALPNRRAVREYTADPVDDEQLGRLLSAARSGPGPHRPAGFEPDECGARTMLAAVHDTPARAAGVYALDVRGGFGERVGGDEDAAVLRDAYADAPVLLFWCGDLARACAEDGLDGHRIMLTAAAAEGYRLWLAAVAAGLGACVFGRSHARVTDLARSRAGAGGPCGSGARHLFTLALGRSVGSDRSPVLPSAVLPTAVLPSPVLPSAVEGEHAR